VTEPIVKRIKSNTIINVLEELLVDPSSAITRDALVRIGKMKHSLRLIETLDSEGNKFSIVCKGINING